MRSRAAPATTSRAPTPVRGCSGSPPTCCAPTCATPTSRRWRLIGHEELDADSRLDAAATLDPPRRVAARAPGRAAGGPAARRRRGADLRGDRRSPRHPGRHRPLADEPRPRRLCSPDAGTLPYDRAALPRGPRGRRRRARRPRARVERPARRQRPGSPPPPFRPRAARACRRRRGGDHRAHLDQPARVTGRGAAHPRRARPPRRAA